MIDEKIEAYLKKLAPRRGEKIEAIEAYALEHDVPIMDLVGMECLLQQLKLVQPKRILEIGTAIGYSAIRMATSLPEVTVVTIERDEPRYLEAKKNVSDLGLTERIQIHFGDALDIFESLEPEADFDVLFIDAAKGQYQRFFDLYSQKVRSGGIIFSDNVLFRGLVTEVEVESKRLRGMVKKLQRYNESLMLHPDYDTRILPVGDGLAISIKK
ncbi:SAM-dependent methyltransferase [Alkalihalobacillus alcalophilus ATCC 27647 = CGMCC 1.3604]|uniref:tRNA 5-hydroxyuridine methyltransferase n=1 Tax=Alkalihalobacillus alcalophilus ATCC 27647 = CGMCC 1.3604 TaxID=1218173 RepID=A0A094WJQ8_ALKAL|nr:O-methyltransferase [Alkalihalobacillus alcalophilus]KGA98014.1 SAM-dependent methyltransferase [Alkalihalobacillus alcalophilus ATCC 27647 = CGMCC 1.3604]MED1561863.1 O-methyltransferase [Alkalihalobacillus alcalophilus]THG90363.1 SAM-dependent methyltransferase [Alkalihalobacillus alcalophilus ATCC 27647 = CGMCC 1.3604]